MHYRLLAAMAALLTGWSGMAAENAAPLPLNDWKASAAHDMPISESLRDGVLRVEAAPDGGDESFPKVGVTLAPPADWRGYNRITMEVLLTSSNADIEANGKELAFVIYDNGLRHANLDGKPSVQQVFAKARVKAGTWQTLDIDLTGAVRGEVTGFEIFMYEMPYSYKHTYEFEFRNVMLRGEDTSRIVLDGASFDPAALRTAPAQEKSVAEVATPDGLALEFGPDGSIVKMRYPGGGRVANPAGMTGVWLRDRKSDGTPFQVGGAVRREGDAVIETAELPEAGLKAEIRYAPDGDFIRVTGQVESTNAEDRALTIYVMLPLNPKLDYDFYSSLSRRDKPFKEVRAVPGFEVKITDYPFTAIAVPTAGQAFGVAVDLGKPVTYRLGVNPKIGVVYGAFDLALIDEVAADGKSLRQGGFDFLIYPTDPAWGMRSAADRYYRHFPEYYVDRVGSGGGWEIPWHRKQSGQSREEIIAGGYRFIWGADETDREVWNRNRADGSYNLIYIEPEFFQFSMGDFASPTNAETLERMRKLTAGDDAEWKKFLPLHYSQAYDCNPHASTADRREFLQSLIQAAVTSGMYDKEGNPILNLGNRVGWIGDSGFGAMVPCNLAPGIPDGRGQATIATCLQPLIDERIADGFVKPNGFGLDCFMDVYPDFRRENFRYMKLPLSFDPETLQPVVPRGFGSIEWLRMLAQRYRPDGMVVMANAFGPITFASPDLDIFGIENTFVTNPEFLRTIAGPNKPTTYLPYDPQEKPKIEAHMFWGIYPGRNVSVDILRPMIPVLDKLFHASWQPVTYAYAEGGLWLERFGKAGDKEIFFTVHNPAMQAVDGRIVFDAAKLGLTEPVTVMEIYPTEQPLTSGPAALPFRLDAGATAVLCVSSTRK